MSLHQELKQISPWPFKDITSTIGPNKLLWHKSKSLWPSFKQTVIDHKSSSKGYSTDSGGIRILTWRELRAGDGYNIIFFVSFFIWGNKCSFFYVAYAYFRLFEPQKTYFSSLTRLFGSNMATTLKSQYVDPHSQQIH